MGWWGCKVLDGDEPLDILGIIAEQCEVEFEDDYSNDDTQILQGYRFTKKILEKHLKEITNNPPESFNYYYYYQVLGELIMFTGAKLPTNLKKEIIKCAKEDPDWDWSTDPERKECMEKYIAALESYKEGVRLVVGDKGKYVPADSTPKRFIVDPN